MIFRILTQSKVIGKFQFGIQIYSVVIFFLWRDQGSAQNTWMLSAFNPTDTPLYDGNEFGRHHHQIEVHTSVRLFSNHLLLGQLLK